MSENRFIKRLRSVLSVCLAILISLSISTVAYAKPQFSAITVDARTGKIMFEDNPDGLRHPASLTKMMTLYLLFQDLKAGRVTRDTKLHVSARASYMAPSKLGLKPGTTITVEEAIKALVTKSANDAAATIAENLGGTESNFAARMTRVAHSIGMTHSNFANASGLPNSAQMTTARDMATLGLRLMRDFPQYYPYFRITAFNFHGRMIKSHNQLVSHYAGTDGIKTGYITTSGFNLVTSTRRGDKRLVGVVLGANSVGSRNSFMMRMFEKNFPAAANGETVAALPGTNKGAINPVADTALEKNTAKPSEVASTQMAKAAANAADETTASTDQTPSDPSATPTVVEAGLTPPDPTIESQGDKLPFAVKSASATPDTLDESFKHSWNIQLGAYPNEQQAKAKLTKIQGDSIAALEGKPAYTIAVQKGKSTLYRVRFAGFDAASAKHACAKISKRGEKCIAVSPES